MNLDFETFKESVPWFLRKTDKIQLLGVEFNFTLTNGFQKTFPKLSEIIKKARIEFTNK